MNAAYIDQYSLNGNSVITKKEKTFCTLGQCPAAEGLDTFFGVPVAYKRRVDDSAKPKKGYLLPFTNR